MMLHHRETVLGHQPYLMARDDESSSQVNAVSKSVPRSTLIVAIVLSVVGLLLFTVVAVWVYRTWRRRRMGFSVPVSKKKKGRQDMLHMHVDLEAAADEKDDSELEKPKRAVLGTNVDDTSPWHTSVDGKNEDIETADQEGGWVPQIKASGYGTNILTPKASFQKLSQPKSPQGPRAMNDSMATTSFQSIQPTPGPSARDDASDMTPAGSIRTVQPAPERRPTHCTTPSLTSSELFAVSPPPSYSAANRLGGVLTRVADIEVLEERRSRTEADNEGITASPPALRSARTHAPSPFPLASSSRSNLDAAMGIAIPLASPARTESRMSMATPASYASSSLRHVKNSSQTSFGRASPTDRSELPRLMTVVNTFVPNLEDELSIKVGETVRMLEEFRDGWCTVQYVGKYDAAKGVVPRICLRERRSIVPVRKSSISSLSSSGSFRR